MAWRARSTAAVVGAAALGASMMAGTAMAADRVETIDPALTPVTIFNINDFHGRIDTNNTGQLGLNFACTLETAKEAAGDTWIFLSAGDNIGASPFTSSILEDVPTIEFLNALELSASAVGNHEFDKGFSDIEPGGRVDTLADFPHLGANVYEQGTTNPVLDEYYVQTVNGVRIGVVGAVTEQTPSLVIPTGVAGLDFGDPVAAVNRVAAQLKDGDEANGEADIVIAEYHEGATGNGTLEEELASGGIFTRIVNETVAEVDAIFTGHTHQDYTYDGPIPGGTGTRPIVQSQSYASFLGEVTLGVDPVTLELVEYTVANVAPTAVTPECEADAQFQLARDIVLAAVAEASELGAEVIGEVTDDITTAFAPDSEGVPTRDDRQRESSLGNLVAEAWLWAMNQPGRTGADIGIMNPGGLRSDLFYEPTGAEGPGEVTYAEAYSINPFANTLQTIDITGAQFKTLLEQQWQPEGASRPFLKLGLSDNVRYTYDADAPVGEKITGIWFNGEPMSPSDTFTVAAGSFLIAGGDNFTVLTEGTNSRDSGQIDSDAFINFLIQNAPVSPSHEKNGVATNAVQPVVVSAGGSTSFEVSGIDLTSLGAPANTEFDVYLGETLIGTAAIETVRIDGIPTRDGRSTVNLAVPADFPVGPTVITLVAAETGTEVKLLAEVKAAATGPVVETDVPAGSTDLGALGLLAGLTVAVAAGAGVVATRRRRYAQH